MFEFSLTSWSAWAPGGLNSQARWVSWGQGALPEAEEEQPDVRDVPMLVRRRLARLGRMAIRTAIDVGCEADSPHLVFSSRYGDSASIPAIMSDIAHGQPVSPGRFSTSVHNAMAGQYAIHTGNMAPHTAIAAGRHSFLHGLLEVQGLLHENPDRTVMLVHYDEPLPEFFESSSSLDTPVLALGLLMTGKGAVDADGLRLTCTPEASADPQEDSALSFIRFLTGAQPTWDHPFKGQTWSCARHA